jgi:TonB family protein
MNRPALTLWFLLACACIASSTAAAAPAATGRDLPSANFNFVRTYFRVCVLAKDADDARARALALGGKAMASAPDADAFQFDFDGTQGRLTLDPRGLCMLAVPSTDINWVLQEFSISLQIRRDDWAYDIVDMRDILYDDYADDQRRPSFGAELPADAVVRARVEVVTPDARNVRLLVLSQRTTETRGSMYLLTEVHADATEQEQLMPGPPRPSFGPRYHSAFPSEAPGGRQAHPVEFPEAAVKACAHGQVRLRVRIDARGSVQDVAIDRSAGNGDLDGAAMDAARHWKFIPGNADGLPVGGEFILPVTFADPCGALEKQ